MHLPRLIIVPVGLVLAAAVLVTVLIASRSDDPVVNTAANAPAGAGVLVGAAGDIACDPADGDFNGGAGDEDECHMRATSRLLLDRDPVAVLALGDTQYEASTMHNYERSYALSWGRVKAITHPAPGNHEYRVEGANGYYEYFGRAAGNPDRGYYSFGLGSWHVVALNSNCDAIGGCHAGSPQEEWLRRNLEANPNNCTLAYMHHPRFSSGREHGSYPEMRHLWQALYDHGADVVLAAHEHNYERFGLQTPSGSRDEVRGIRQFVVGTGGKSLYAFGTPLANSQVRHAGFGVLFLQLRQSDYRWRFVSEAGESFTDTGSDGCV